MFRILISVSVFSLSRSIHKNIQSACVGCDSVYISFSIWSHVSTETKSRVHMFPFRNTVGRAHSWWDFVVTCSLAISKEASRFLSWCRDWGGVGLDLCFMTVAQDPAGRGQKQEKQGETNREKRIRAAEFLGKMWLWQEVYTQVQKYHYTLWTRGWLTLEHKVRHMIVHDWEHNIHRIMAKSSHHSKYTWCAAHAPHF